MMARLTELKRKADLDAWGDLAEFVSRGGTLKAELRIRLRLALRAVSRPNQAIAAGRAWGGVAAS